MLGGLYDEYVQEFQPETAIEIHLVETLISARWQCQRYRLIENALMELELLRTSEAPNTPIGEGVRLALAFKKQCGKASALKAALQAATQCERSYQSNLKLLRSEMANRPEPPAPPLATSSSEARPAPGVLVFPSSRPYASRFPAEPAASDPAFPVPKQAA